MSVVINVIVANLLSTIPGPEREAIQREAIRRECSMEELLKEAIIEKSRRIISGCEKKAKRQEKEVA